MIYTYNSNSKSAKLLSNALGVKRIKRANSRFKPRHHETVINWGCSSVPMGLEVCNVINKPERVGIASNKLRFFRFMAGKDVRTPDFTVDKELVELDGSSKIRWVARHELSGHSGSGIELIHGDCQEIPNAPLYVKYIPKSHEYRVHVINGKVIDVQRKARSSRVADEDVNWSVRTHSTGFIFARNEGHEPPEDVKVQGLRAVNELGLDFGAVDVVYQEKSFSAFVLEVNTAPGLTGQTLDNYARELGGYY